MKKERTLSGYIQTMKDMSSGTPIYLSPINLYHLELSGLVIRT
jgi:hypothetical protein